MNRRIFDPRKNRLAVSIAILVVASWVGDSIFASDYVLKEVAVIAHPHGLARCPRSFHDGRVAVLGTHGNLFILNPQVEATPSRRIDLFDVEDMAFFPQSNLLLCAGHDLVAVDLESNTFHLLNVSAINWGDKEPTADDAASFSNISVHRDTGRFVCSVGSGFAIGSVTDLSNTRLVYSDYCNSAFLSDGRIVQVGDNRCRICRLTPEGTSYDEVYFRRSGADDSSTVTLQNFDQSDSGVTAKFSYGSFLIRTSGDSKSSIAVFPMSSVARPNSETDDDAFEIWNISPQGVKMVSIVPASALQRWILDPHSWVDTFLVELDAGQSETKHVLHLFRGGAMIAEIRLSLDGKPQAGHYAFVDFAASTGKTPNIVAASSLGGNRILVTDAEGRLRILECVPAASQ